MPKFAANLSFIFQEVGFLERFAAAARCGFKAVEYLSPYDHQPKVIAEQLNRHGLEQALFNMPPGDWAAGERGIGALPGREQEFRDEVETALVYARATRCRILHAMAGVLPAGLDRAQAERTLLMRCARHLEPMLAEHVLHEPRAVERPGRGAAEVIRDANVVARSLHDRDAVDHAAHTDVCRHVRRLGGRAGRGGEIRRHRDQDPSRHEPGHSEY